MLEIGYTTIVQVFNFCILFFFLNIFLYKPLTSAIKEREGQIKNTLDEAEGLNIQAQSLKEDYEEKLKELKKEAQNLIKKAAEDGEKVKSEIINEAKKEAKYLTESAQSALKLQEREIFQKLKSQVAVLAVAMAEKILNENLNLKTHQELVENILKRANKEC
ncbi:MAG: F0F1 ATP synthase subunit B [Armatimonadetes bacterium]|nr:F0F1 ATP synthase subunit B [Armatimonadota bacterium]